MSIKPKALSVIERIKQQNGVSETEVRDEKFAKAQAAFEDDSAPPAEEAAILKKYGFNSMDDIIKLPDVQPELVVVPIPSVEPAAELVSIGSAWSEWLKSKQAMDITNPHTINLQRLHAVLPDRIEAAFRAGFAAGRG